MKTALVIMAAGIGSRFGGGIKQLEPVGPTGENIMDYSIHDAIAVGFSKIVFIIRRDLEEDFRTIIGNRMEAVCKKLGVEVAYAYQELDDLPAGVTKPEGRMKPWGTGQALLCCRPVLHEPFAVINADDYYGKEAFRQLYQFLQSYDPKKPWEFCMAGFILKNTLSDNGGVTRGICKVSDTGYLEKIDETKNIRKDGTRAYVAEADGTRRELDPNCHVSMNMWGMTPEVLDELDRGFVEFFHSLDFQPQKSEFLIPIYVDQLLKAGKISVKVLPTMDDWFGVTYQEDKKTVTEAFRQLIRSGVYDRNLFSDLL